MDRRTFVLALALTACAAPLPVRTAPFPEEVLSAARTALGFDALLERTGGFEVVGDRSEAGETFPFRFVFDGSGRTLVDLAGSIPYAEGLDGQRTWSQDSSGLVRELGLGAAERVRCEAWLRTGLWLDPWVPRFKSNVDPRRSTDTRTAIALSRPDTPFRATLWIDNSERLPVEYEIEGAGRRVRLERYERIAGMRIPHRVVQVLAGGYEIVDEASLVTPTLRASLTPPRSLPRDTSFDPIADSAVDTRVGADGRLYIRALLDGAEAVTLLVDTGFGCSAIDPAIADRLDWTDAGAVRLRGIGGASGSRQRRANTIGIGPLEVRELAIAELDPLSTSRSAGFQVDGVLGADVLARAVFVLDPARGSVELRDPTQPLQAEWPWQTIEFDGTAPCVRGRIGTSAPLWLRFDTGSNDTLSIAPWAVTQLKLAPSVADLDPAFLVGPFGSIRVWRSELAEVEVAGCRIPRLPATLLDPVDGVSPLDDPFIAGNLGLTALRTMRIVLDLGRRRLALVYAP